MTAETVKQPLKDILAVIHEYGVTRSKMEGHIYRVWEDGEVTLTKCGNLLDQRNEHVMEFGFKKSVSLDIMPAKQNVDSVHAFCFCASSETADTVRELIREELFGPKL